jgi:stringent starvation protein B
VRELVIPVAAVSAIYARENGQGMSFETTGETASGAEGESAAAPGTPKRPPGSGGKPALRRVK